MSNHSNFKPFTPEYWEESYRSGDMGWDLGGPTPIFNQWIDTCKQQLKICILGAGNGWDAINFSKRGHIVTAVDFAKLATTNMLIAAKNNHVEMDIRHMDIFDLNQIYENHLMWFWSILVTAPSIQIGGPIISKWFIKY